MSKLLSELKLIALMSADEIARKHKQDSELKEVAYKRAKLFTKVAYPRCWVNKEFQVGLDRDA